MGGVRPRAPAAGAVEPAAQRRALRPAGAARGAHHAGRRRGPGGAECDRQRPGRPAGEPGRALRAVLHHRQQGHGPRAVSRARALRRQPRDPRVRGRWARRALQDLDAGEQDPDAGGASRMKRADQRGGAARGAQVLVVDDEPDIRELLELTLVKMGLGVHSAGTIAEAKPKLKEESFDLCLTDMRLADGEGLELVRHISTLGVDLPVAVITAYGSAENAVAALKAGAFDYVSKPVGLEQLRAIEEKRVRKVGSTQEEPADVRIICATNQSLAAMVEAGRFRRDLYYRLNVVDLTMPPLRECRDDIPRIASSILERLATQNGVRPQRLSKAALEELMQYNFPGNVRELENLLERALALSTGAELSAEDLALHRIVAEDSDAPEAASKAAGTREEPLHSYLDRLERDAILAALGKTGFNRTAAARLLGITFRQLRYRMQRLGIREDKPAGREEKSQG